MSKLSAKLMEWLAAHDDQLVRFRTPIPVEKLATEVNEAPTEISKFLADNSELVFHLWGHTYKGRTTRSKPYCLRLNGVDTVGLDWEDSVVGAAEAMFRRQGYQTARELGNEAHLASLIVKPDLTRLTSGVNQRDLWALRQRDEHIELIIIEAKGKEAYEFDHYCFAEALAQVFPVPAEPLSLLLGTKRGSGHGLCWQYAKRLYTAWLEAGFKPTITVALLLPEWTPDIVWSGGKIRHIPDAFYSRPLAEFRQFLTTGETASQIGKYQ